MKKILVVAFSVASLSLVSVLIGACGSDSIAGAGSSSESNKAAGGEKKSSGGSAITFAGLTGRSETYCFNGKCSTCSTTDKITLSIDSGEVELIAEGPVLTFPSCAAEAGVSDNKWTMRGTFSGDAATSGNFSITSCYASGKWQGSGSGTVESGGKVKADLQCNSSDTSSKKSETDKVEWKGLALNKQ